MLYAICGLMVLQGCLMVVTGIRNKLPFHELHPDGTDIKNSRLGNRYVAYVLGALLIVFSIALFIVCYKDA
jgi:hypothetical protein